MGLLYRGFINVAAVLLIALLGVCLACGLYFVSDLAEQHPSKFKKWLQYALVAVLSFHVILLIDGLPFFEVLVGVVCHLCYALVMRQFPFIEFTSTPCLLSIIGIVLDQYVWFAYFGKQRESMAQVNGFFLVMVWLIPFSLFLGMTVNDNILPGIGPNSFHGIKDSSADGKSRNLFRGFMDYVMVWRTKDAQDGGVSSMESLQTNFNKERFD